MSLGPGLHSGFKASLSCSVRLSQKAKIIKLLQSIHLIYLNSFGIGIELRPSCLLGQSATIELPPRPNPVYTGVNVRLRISHFPKSLA